MYIKIFDLDKKNLSSYTRENIKEKYKKIALECHPDKLFNIQNENIKNEKTEKFKKASLAYKMAMEQFDNYGTLSTINYEYNYDNMADDYDTYKNMDLDFWNDIYNEFFSNKEEIEKTFVDVAKMFLKKGIHSKKYYNPSTTSVKHNITLPLSYNDLYNTKKKKIQIILKNIKEPFNISILCSKEYPLLTRQYIDDNGTEHDIELKMVLKNNDNSTYTHQVRKSGAIDLFTNININLCDYIKGSDKKIEYIDGNNIDIKINSFDLNNILLANKGLIGGDLIISLNLNNMDSSDLDKLTIDEKLNFIKYVEKIYEK
jgi:DnaJ-class molecular chaperone